ncbi:MAG: butyrate kinase [Mobilitalea sp.]
MRKYKIFAINPGSTSTKIALIEGESVLFKANVNHDADKLAQFKEMPEQLPYRKETILKLLEDSQISLEGVDAFVGRGGGLLSLPGGTYEIDEILLRHARTGANGVTHPAQLGSQLAHEFCLQYGGKEYVVNPPDVDEFEDIARVTGIKDISRASHIHSLNQKETAIRHAKSIGKSYEECNFIVCHIGGGISVAAHKKGKMVDGTDIVEGEGPMAPTRAGAVPCAPLIRMCYSGKYTEKDMLAKCTRNGGLVDLTGTADALEISNKALQGDRYAKLIWDAMIYQINKSIGSMATVLHGKVDGILLGGGMVYNMDLVSQITEGCSFIAPVVPYPGEFEMEAMASGAIRVLEGRESAKRYSGIAAWTGFDNYREAK